MFINLTKSLHQKFSVSNKRISLLSRHRHISKLSGRWRGARRCLQVGKWAPSSSYSTTGGKDADMADTDSKAWKTEGSSYSASNHIISSFFFRRISQWCLAENTSGEIISGYLQWPQIGSCDVRADESGYAGFPVDWKGGKKAGGKSNLQSIASD